MMVNSNDQTINFLQEKTIPQVMLLTCHQQFFQSTINFFIKKIICLLPQSCDKQNRCENCQSLTQKAYFGLNWKKLGWQDSLKKGDVESIITDLRLTNLNNNPKILIIEQIEYCSKVACNAMLKLLENLPKQVFIIFATSNLNNVLSTIKSRAQVITFSDSVLNQIKKNNTEIALQISWWHQLQADTSQITESEVNSVLAIVKQFIDYDNEKKQAENFLLIKEIMHLKEKVHFFFAILKMIINDKLKSNQQKNEEQVKPIKKISEIWKLNNQQILVDKLILVTETISMIDNKTNFLLLLNYFMINFYQGVEDETSARQDN